MRLPETIQAMIFSQVRIREGFDLIPMWVADMNFPALPAIPEAIIQRTKHPAYGYFDPSEAYYDGIINWQKTRNGVNDLTKECIGYENGVLGGVVSALKYCVPMGILFCCNLRRISDLRIVLRTMDGISS